MGDPLRIEVFPYGIRDADVVSAVGDLFCPKKTLKRTTR